jgi:hypothetical protein
MALGSFRSTLRTSSAEKHYPFQVEVVNGRDILCHVGRVYEQVSKDTYGELIQKSWSAEHNKIQNKGLPYPHSYNKNQLRYHDHDVHTGSTNIHYAGTSDFASHGRGTLITAGQTVGYNGYVRWNRTGSPTHNYVVLHREEDEEIPNTGKWIISTVDEGDVLPSDIVIAYIHNATTVRQVWKSDVYSVPNTPATPTDPTLYDHPWKVWDDNNGTTINMTAGSVDNVMPMGGAPRATYNLYTSGTTMFYLSCTFSSTTISSAQVITSPTALYNNETNGYVLLATVTKTTVGGVATRTIVQYVKHSLWAEKFKCAQQPAEYWFSTV